MGTDVEASGSRQRRAHRASSARYLASGRRTPRSVAVVWVVALVGGLTVTGPASAVAGDTTRVSVSTAGVAGNGDSLVPSISGDGRYVAFESAASNLVEGDTNGVMDVFVRDRQTGETTRVSVDSDGLQGNGASVSVAANNFGREGPTISADGRYVAFSSLASNLVDGDTNDAMDVFVRDRDTRTTTRVSVASDGTQAFGWSFHPVISADGRFVAFGAESTADTLVPGDTNEASDVFLHDRETATTTRISVASDGTQANWFSELPAISGDGRYVAFNSGASNLDDGDTNGVMDVFVRDTEEDTTTLVSLASDGTQATGGDSFTPSITTDGQRVAFTSRATNLVSGDTNGVPDVFVRDLSSAATTRVSVASDGTQADGESYAPMIAGIGGVVVFESAATNLVASDTNSVMDVFVRDLADHTMVRASVATDGSEGDDFSRSPAVDRQGRFVAFEARAANLVGGDDNQQTDVFIHELPAELGLMVGKLWFDADGERTEAPAESVVTLDAGEAGTIHEDDPALTVEAGTTYTVSENLPDGWTEIECPPEFQEGEIIGLPLDDPTKGFFPVLGNGAGEFTVDETGIHLVCNGPDGVAAEPTVTIDPASGPPGTEFTSTGEDFSPDSTATSHLKRPDGSQFDPLVLDTNSAGSFAHEINSTGFAAGIYSHQVVDDTTGASSNTVTFEVTIPVIRVEPSSGPRGTRFQSLGTGFSPDTSVTSHLRKPDGTEFPPLALATDSDGSFSHFIDSSGFRLGTYEHWVVDDATGAVADATEFKVTRPEPPPPPGAVSKPRFQVPFPCGQTWHGATYTGHPSWTRNPGAWYPLDLNHNNGPTWESANGVVVASAAGQIVRSGLGSGGWGYYVELRHESGWRTFYAHLEQGTIPVNIRPGLPIAEGDKLGEVGGTGGWPLHLHYEQIHSGAAQPIEFDGTPIAYSFVFDQDPPPSNGIAFRSNNNCH